MLERLQQISQLVKFESYNLKTKYWLHKCIVGMGVGEGGEFVPHHFKLKCLCVSKTDYIITLLSYNFTLF